MRCFAEQQNTAFFENVIGDYPSEETCSRGMATVT